MISLISCTQAVQWLRCAWRCGSSEVAGDFLITVGLGILVAVVLTCTVPLYSSLVANVQLQQQLGVQHAPDLNIEIDTTLGPILGPSVGSHMTSSNRETQAALAFHNASKYSVIRDETGEERFIMGSPPDPDSAAYEEGPALLPLPYKIYETLTPIPLPHDLPPTTLPGLEALSRTGAELKGAREAVVDLAKIARIALLSNGLLGRTRTNPHRERTVEYRTAGGTGALYHLELYFICADCPI